MFSPALSNDTARPLSQSNPICQVSYGIRSTSNLVRCTNKIDLINQASLAEASSLKTVRASIFALSDLALPRSGPICPGQGFNWQLEQRSPQCWQHYSSQNYRWLSLVGNEMAGVFEVLQLVQSTFVVLWTGWLGFYPFSLFLFPGSQWCEFV